MNHIITVALILWVISGVAYRKARRNSLGLPKVTITPLSIEDQLDIMIHTNEIDEACGYCGTSQNPNDICITCFINLKGATS